MPAQDATGTKRTEACGPHSSYRRINNLYGFGNYCAEFCSKFLSALVTCLLTSLSRHATRLPQACCVHWIPVARSSRDFFCRDPRPGCKAGSCASRVISRMTGHRRQYRLWIRPGGGKNQLRCDVAMMPAGLSLNSLARRRRYCPDRCPGCRMAQDR